jgi:hypothetical protein
VCDVVGGVAAVGLESQSVRYGAMAAEKFAAAAAAQVEADSATAEAIDLKAKAAQEADEAEALESEAKKLEAQAEEKLAQAEADEAAAQENLAKSALDEALAGEEDAKATAEEDASASTWNESVRHGACACGKAMIVSVASAFAILFWAVRITGSAVLPCITALCRVSVSVISRGHPSRFISAGAQSFSHIWHHFTFFVVFFGVWGAAILQLPQLSIKSMGGVLLGFSASSSAAQSLLMHVVPKVCQHEGSQQVLLLTIFHELSRRMLVLWPLAIFEILLVWVNAGKQLFVPSVVHLAQSRWIPVVLAATVATHHACFTWHSRSGGNGTENEGSSPGLDVGGGGSRHSEDTLLCKISLQKTCVNYGSGGTSLESNAETTDDEWKEISRSEHLNEPLLHAASHISDEPRVPCREKWFHQTVIDDCKSVRLLLVFELLMASVTIAFFRQSTPMLLTLWPASKEFLLAEWPHWHLAVLMSTAAAVLVLTCACW